MNRTLPVEELSMLGTSRIISKRPYAASSGLENCIVRFYLAMFIPRPICSHEGRLKDTRLKQAGQTDYRKYPLKMPVLLQTGLVDYRKPKT